MHMQGFTGTGFFPASHGVADRRPTRRISDSPRAQNRKPSRKPIYDVGSLSDEDAKTASRVPAAMPAL
jgi:hypothetical protein